MSRLEFINVTENLNLLHAIILTLIGLKLFEVITIKWEMVFIPLYVYTALMMTVLVFRMATTMTENMKRRREL